MTALRITGADLSGSSGDANRTYIVSDTSFSTSDIQIFISGSYAYKGSGKDYTTSGSTITFLNNVFDDESIDILYTAVSTTTSADSYGTTLELARFMGIECQIPDLATVGEDRTKETIGTGDNSETIFYLDHAYVLAESYSIFYGSAESSATELTETTHYTLNKDIGKLTLTSAGVTLVGTNNIYGSYSYCCIGLTDTQLADALNRAKAEIDKLTNNHFVDSTVATPDWNQSLDEKQSGKGAYDRNYFTLQNYPIPDVSTTTNGAILEDDTTITVVSTSGFPSSGYILIENDKISYTGKTDTTFTGCSSVSAHDDAKTVRSYVVEISSTDSGGTITWDVLSEDTEFDIDRKTGRVHIYGDGSYWGSTVVDIQSSPLKGVANRFRVSYISGESSIPNDIVKATLMLAAKDIMSLAVRSAHSRGLNDFDPGLINVDQDEFNRLIEAYRNEQYMKV